MARRDDDDSPPTRKKRRREVETYQFSDSDDDEGARFRHCRVNEGLEVPDTEDEPDEGERRRRRKKTTRKRKKQAIRLLILSGIGLAFLIIVIVVVLALKKDRTGPFKDQMADYLTGEVKRNGPMGAKGTGKLVVVSEKLKGLDDLHFSLPDSIRAEGPSEVQMVARVTWGENQVGVYSNGSKGFVHTCHVLVFDVNTRLVLDEQTFTGGQPPSSIQKRSTDTGAVHGSKPTEAVQSYLSSLRK